ncbi:MAG: hypothetical protein ABIB71_04555 [Candidatus Woesearchaeota archaeon]
MQKLNFMNSKEVKVLIRELEEQYGCQLKIERALLKSSKDKVYAISKDFAQINDKQLRVNNLGMYFCKFEKDGIRLTIEGAQLLSPKKNFIDINKEEAAKWIRGEDIETDAEVSGYIIIRHNNDIIGCGKFKEGRILNYTPKDRRIKAAQ